MEKIKYHEVNGTFYHEETPQEVIAILETNRIQFPRKNRIALHYGDTKTGRPWGDVEEGYIGRSTGSIKIPLIINNRRSMGGSGILDHCILRIRITKYPYTILYERKV